MSTVKKQLVLFRNPQLPEQDLPDLARSVAVIVFSPCAIEDALDVDPRDLQGDRRVPPFITNADLADVGGPGAALGQDDLPLATRYGRPNTAVV